MGRGTGVLSTEGMGAHGGAPQRRAWERSVELRFEPLMAVMP